MICESPDATAFLARALHHHRRETEAPLGFVLRRPTRGQNLHVLTDRTGYVLGRTRDEHQAVAILAGHLAAFLPPESGLFRLRTRALLGAHDTITLGFWPILATPPIVERRLERSGFRLVDRLVVDIDPATALVSVSELPWPLLADVSPGTGHVSPSGRSLPITAMLVPGLAGAPQPTLAQLVHLVASKLVNPHDLSIALDAADRIASRAEAHMVMPGNPKAVYTALEQPAEASPGPPASIPATAEPTHEPAKQHRTRTVEESYDELSYGALAFPQTHPVALATMAELRGVAATPVGHARVLELGCAEGGNLIPLAEAYPEAHFVGIDLSDRQLERGRSRANALGLANLELLHMNVLDVDDNMGQFDYIVAHGVYSWVPPEVQAAILSICRERATPQGVSFVSYNTFPGWHLRGTLRRLLLEHTDADLDLVDRVDAARDLLGRMADDANPDDPYGVQLVTQVEDLLDATDAYIAHEYLASINDPVWHTEFVRRASGAGLRHLGDHASRSMDVLSGNALISTDGNDPRRLEYQDMVRNTAFRAAIMCRDDVTVRAGSPDEHMLDFEVGTWLIPHESGDGDGILVYATPGPETESSVKLEVASVGLQAILDELVSRAPASVAVRDLVDVVTDRIGDAEGTDVAAFVVGQLYELHSFYRSRAIWLLREGFRFTTTVSERPRVSALARQQARDGEDLVNRRHEPVTVRDSLLAAMIPLLDGTNTVADLAALLAPATASGDEADTGDLQLGVEERLGYLARNALLID